ALIDLFQSAEAIPVRLSIVAGPIDLGCGFTKARALATQQMNAAIGGSQLHVFIALIDCKAAQTARISGFDRDRHGSQFPAPWRAQRAEMNDEIGEVLVAELHRGHAAAR